MGDGAELRPKMVELRDRDLRPLDGETDPPHSVEALPLAFLGQVPPLGKNWPNQRKTTSKEWKHVSVHASQRRGR